MVKLDVDVKNLEALDFEFAPQCEAGGHGSDTANHAGDAQWLRTSGTSPCCGEPWDSTYTCDKFYRYIHSWDYLACAGCDGPVYVRDMKFVRI